MNDKLRAVRLLLLDVDGVLTDGRIVLNDRGEETKAFNVRDGHGLKMLQRAGVEIGIITGRHSRVVAHRMRELGIDLVFQGAKSKLEPFQDILAQRDLNPDQVAYVGDDIVDLPILSRVGFSATVADGCVEVRQRVDYVSHFAGGQGAVREICEMLLKAQGRWDQIITGYLAD